MTRKPNKQTDGFSSPKSKRKTAANSSSIGTAADLFDWKTREHKTFLSQGELKFYYILRWQDNVVDIKTQYPLDNQLVDKVIKKLSEDDTGKTDVTELMNLADIDVIDDNREPYTTDMLAILKDGTCKAFQVKPTIQSINYPKIARRLLIEQAYFRELKIPWQIIYADEINNDYYQNIRSAVQFYDPKECHNDISKFQCLVSHKLVDLDMESSLVDWKKETQKYLDAHDGVISLKGVILIDQQ